MISSILIGIICMLIVYIFISRMRYRRELRSIAEQLAKLQSQPNSAVLFHQTHDPGLKLLLVEINRVIRAAQDTSISFSQKELAMKKMLTNMSHDLRTPLTVVLGFAETLLQDPAGNTQENKKSLTLLHSKTKEIIQLINRFFELVRLESDDVEIPLTQVDLTEISKQNILGFYQQIEAKRLTMDLQLPDQPVFALANKDALDRILQNLLSNAIRYGSEGNVIGMALRMEEQFVCIEVWDRGKGISAPYLKLVFDRLYKGEEMEGQQTGGTGLGLSITKKLTEKMQGSIGISSTPYSKTVVTVKLQRSQGA